VLPDSIPKIIPQGEVVGYIKSKKKKKTPQEGCGMTWNLKK